MYRVQTRILTLTITLPHKFRESREVSFFMWDGRSIGTKTINTLVPRQRTGDRRIQIDISDLPTLPPMIGNGVDLRNRERSQMDLSVYYFLMTWHIHTLGTRNSLGRKWRFRVKDVRRGVHPCHYQGSFLGSDRRHLCVVHRSHTDTRPRYKRLGFLFTY